MPFFDIPPPLDMWVWKENLSMYYRVSCHKLLILVVDNLTLAFEDKKNCIDKKLQTIVVSLKKLDMDGGWGGLNYGRSGNPKQSILFKA